MSERKPISKRMRFDVLKRDHFTCQYCGGKSPEKILHIDHIKPVSKGGKNTMLNLVTSCIDCNLGKSNKLLSDDSAVIKQQKETELLAEKKTQIELMIKWQESLNNADEKLYSSVEKLVNSYLVDRSVNENGMMKIRKAVKKNGYEKVFKSVSECYMRSESIEVFAESWAKAILHCYENKGFNIHYIKGILKNRLDYFNERWFYITMNNHEITKENESIYLDAAKNCRNQTHFYELISEEL